MPKSTSRRQALKTIGAAGAGFALSPVFLRGQGAPIIVAGTPVEIAIAQVSPSNVRISVLPIAGGAAAPMPNDQALVAAANGKPLRAQRSPFTPVRVGNLTVRYSSDPPTLHIDTAKGDSVQKLTLDAQAPTMKFGLGKGPLLGFGEGGPQFDRKGQVYGTRNGQAGYQLRTHGGRVPIQWFVSTDGGACMCTSRLALSI